MEGSSGAISEAKYQKLASEYAKLRAQASVLKKAVLEEQAKSSSLREQLRQHESALRRSEQEVDSLGFRNKQLEHRVTVLQEEIATRESKKREKDQKKNTGKSTAAMQDTLTAGANCAGDLAQDALIFEELQKKIMENAQLTLLIDDKERELQLHTEHVDSLEQTLAMRAIEQSELEKRLRRDLETFQSRNSELETKLVEAASMLGSEDALSASGSENTPHTNTLHQHHNHQIAGSVPAALHHTGEERIAFLEREILHWRTQYEIVKLSGSFANNHREGVAGSAFQGDANCSCSTTAAGISVQPSFAETKRAQRESLKEPAPPPTKEQLLYNRFSKKFEDLLKARLEAESRLCSYETETKHLHYCLENATYELRAKDEQVQSINQALQMLEEDLATTRHAYEEQISVLQEQVISLSEQLAASK